MGYEYKQEIIPFSIGRTTGYKNNPDRIEFINEQSSIGWRFVGSFIENITGNDMRYDGWPVSATRDREVMTFERETP